MIKHLKHNLVAYVALFAALGGSAYAAGKIGSSQIKANAVKSKHVKDGSLAAGDFAPGALPAGERGPTGEPGEQGPQGVQGERGPSNAYAVRDIAFSARNSVELNVPPGDYIVDAKVSVTKGQGGEELKTSCSVGGTDLGAEGGDLSYASLDSGTSSDASETALSLHAAVKIPAGPIRMECFRPAGVGLGRWSMVAVEVANLELTDL